jgi:AMP deaminase
VTSFDIVDDEKQAETIPEISMERPPQSWTNVENPPYYYYAYYVYANLAILNQYRKSRGMNILFLPPKFALCFR